MPTQIRERICVSWHLNFVVDIVDGTAVSSYFSEKYEEPVILSDFSEGLMKRLEDYFRGKPVDFKDVPAVYPTAFSKKVLEFVRHIPYGSVKTYSEIAKTIKSSPRAVGNALRMNRVPVIIPCHRVVSGDGIGGYSEGVELKRMLLELEGQKFRF